MDSRETIVVPGEEIKLTIETVNHSGEGVGRYKGLAVFVPFTVPGEEAVVRITGLRKNFAYGAVVKLLSLSDRRTEPRCPAFDTCGGSQFQHIDYQLQLELKQRLVEDSLKRIGKITGVSVKPAIGMAQPWGYRNKAQFQVNPVEGRIRLGFFEEGTHTLVPSADCLLLDSQIREIALMVEEILNKFAAAPYDRESGTGLVRNVVIRKGWYTSEVMVVLVTSDEKFPDEFALAGEIRDRVPEIVSVVRNICTNPGRQVLGRENHVLSGQGTIIDKLGDLVFHISPTSFFQVNSLQTEILYEKVLEFAGLTGQETVLDIYCGIGTISLFLARQAGRVIGFEVSREAVDDATGNARANRITNAEFVSGKAEECLPKLVKQGVNPDVIVVDPPRQGVEKRALQAIADMAPKKLIYVSCDPATMARDANFLSFRGYRIKEVQPVDMFPQTNHVECIIMMTNSGLKGK
ncbi:MAG: 23S rRNA (uracil(1939)-C(5))-methyltransferase RlmD [Eubacteriales bacterium]